MLKNNIIIFTKLLLLITLYTFINYCFSDDLENESYKKLKVIEKKLLITKETYSELVKLERELLSDLSKVNKNIKKYKKLVNKGFSEKKSLEKIILSRNLSLEKEKEIYEELKKKQALIIKNIIISNYKGNKPKIENEISKNILNLIEKKNKKNKNEIVALKENINANKVALDNINISLKNIEITLNSRSNELEGLIGESIINEIEKRENKIKENKITKQANEIKNLIENFEKKQVITEPFGKFKFKKLSDILPINRPLIKNIKTAKLKTGVLLSIKNNTTLKAPNNSLVVYADIFKGYGKMIILDLGNDYHLILSGVSNILCNTGDWLEKGGIIGDIIVNDKKEFYMEFRFKGKTINPSKWMRS